MWNLLKLVEYLIFCRTTNEQPMIGILLDVHIIKLLVIDKYNLSREDATTVDIVSRVERLFLDICYIKMQGKMLNLSI